MKLKRKLKSIKPKIKKTNLNVVKSTPIRRIEGRRRQVIRNRILERDEYTCQKCGIVSLHLEVDHIIPLHLGGADNDENRQALCKKCHRKKTKTEIKERHGKT